MEVTASFERRPTRQVQVGSVPVGGGSPITVQSMTTTKTADVEGTLQQVIAALGFEGGDVGGRAAPTPLASAAADAV